MIVFLQEGYRTPERQNYLPLLNKVIEYFELKNDGKILYEKFKNGKLNDTADGRENEWANLIDVYDNFGKKLDLISTDFTNSL